MEKTLTHERSYLLFRESDKMRIVLRIGGSVIASPLNPALMSQYANILKELRKRKHTTVTVVGGGSLAREMIAAAKQLGLDENAQDELAISASRLFAQLLSKKLDGACGSVPSTVASAAKRLSESGLVVMGGLKPGMTTDTVAALVAKRTGADLLVKATDQEGVYDKDPKRHADAVKLDRLAFEDLSRVCVEDRHRAGIHQIIDPEAIKLLKRDRIRVVVVNGFKPENVLLAAEGRKVGTLIE